MADISSGTIVTIKKGVFWKGHDLSNKNAVVVSSESYILVEIDGIAEVVKLFRTEISTIMTEDEYFFHDYSDIFEEEGW